MPPMQHVGGSFAPPIDEAKLAGYESLAVSAGGRVGEEMAKLLKMTRAWWELPESTRPGTEHPSTPRAAVIPLEDAHVKALWDLVPWPDELKLLSNGIDSGVFDSLTGPLRDAAFHLLWFAGELTLDREPITLDKLA